MKSSVAEKKLTRRFISSAFVCLGWVILSKFIDSSKVNSQLPTLHTKPKNARAHAHQTIKTRIVLDTAGGYSPH